MVQHVLDPPTPTMAQRRANVPPLTATSKSTVNTQ
jgi:hypothetical protein